MTDMYLESLRAIFIAVTLLTLIRGQRIPEFDAVKGRKTILCGLLLIFFGTLIDITDNFPQLNQFIIVGDTPTQAFLEKFVGYLLGFMLIAIGTSRWLPQVAEHQKRIADDLAKTKEEVNTLQGLLPICASCKKVRDDQGYWKKIETYISDHSEVEFTHGICPKCAEKLYPDYHSPPPPQKDQQAPTIATKDNSNN